ncbi:hypothetical protein A8924_1290 [Saccharopolyspora erythraea NRRL 2338]|nr:hypothetical protein A8924_1290 [Saccharopolyspora erythraea NRRL 2338]
MSRRAAPRSSSAAPTRGRESATRSTRRLPAGPTRRRVSGSRGTRDSSTGQTRPAVSGAGRSRLVGGAVTPGCVGGARHSRSSAGRTRRGVSGTRGTRSRNYHGQPPPSRKLPSGPAQRCSWPRNQGPQDEDWPHDDKTDAAVSERARATKESLPDEEESARAHAHHLARPEQGRIEKNKARYTQTRRRPPCGGRRLEPPGCYRRHQPAAIATTPTAGGQPAASRSGSTTAAAGSPGTATPAWSSGRRRCTTRTWRPRRP